MPARTEDGPDEELPADLRWAARVQRLEAEVEGLHRAMRSRGVIEQAKGMLAERLRCDPEEAFAELSRMSQRANTRLAVVAADLVGAPRALADPAVADPAPVPAATDPVAAAPVDQVLRAALDNVFGPAMLLAPVRDDAGTVVDFVIEAVGRDLRDALGHDSAARVGRRLLDAYGHLATNGVFDAYVAVCRTGVPYDRPAARETVLRDGEPREVTLARRAARIGDRVLVSWRNLEPEVRQEHRLRRLEDLGNLGWLDDDLGTRTVYWSPGAYRIFGRDQAEPGLGLGRLGPLTTPAGAVAAAELHDRVVSTGQPAGADLAVVVGGEQRTVRVSAEPRLGPGGAVVGVRAALQDVTEHRRADRQLSVLQAQLAEQRMNLSAARSVTAQLRRLFYPTSDCSLRTATVEVAGLHLVPPADWLLRGDFCDVTALPGDGGEADPDVLLILADSYGAGLAAAVGLSALRPAARALGRAGVAPAQILRTLNAELHQSDEPPMASMLVGRFDAATRTLEWAQAGHPAPILVPGHGAGASSARLLERPAGPALGLVPDARFASARITLAPGDTVVWYSDAVAYGRAAPRRDEAAVLARRFGAAVRRAGVAGVIDECEPPDRDEAVVLAMALNRQ